MNDRRELVFYLHVQEQRLFLQDLKNTDMLTFNF